MMASIFFLLMPTGARSQSGTVTTGHVYNANNCAGIANLTVKLTPPTGPTNQTQLITTTDENGDFQLQAPGSGNYYLAIYQGTNQLYGRVTNLQDQLPVMIALKPTAQNQWPSNGIGCVSPVALALSSQGFIFALDEHFGIVRYSIADKNGNPQVIVHFDSAWQTMDMVLVNDRNTEHLFVTLVQGSAGQLVKYSTSGAFEGSWSGFSQVDGLCADQSGERVYMSVPGTGQILQVPFSAEANFKIPPLFRISNVRDVDSLAFDNQTRTLYAASFTKGDIYSLDIATSTLHEVADDVGAPTAVTFDPTSRSLFVADAGSKIWKVLLSPKVKAATFAKQQPLKAPSAIAVGSDKTVWVGDHSAHAIFQFSSDGRLIRTLK
jgi:hypothetical protein